MSVDLLNKADTLTETCGISGLALLLLIKLAWKAESDGTFRYPEVTYKHCKKSFKKPTFYRVKK